MPARKLILLAALAVLLLTPACALINLVVPQPTATPQPQRVLRPTFTPTPLEPAAPPAEAGPLAAADNATPVAQPILEPPAEPSPQPPPTQPPPTPTPLPTSTPTATPTPLPPTATPTPFAVVAADQVRARLGPGTIYDRLGELNSGTQLTIVGRDETGDWWQLCCLDDQVVWIFGDLLSFQGSTAGIAVAANIPPTPTPTATPTPKPYVIARNPRINVRSGPGTNFKILGVVERGDRLEVIGRDYDASWWQVCCVDGQEGWITADLVDTEGAIEAVALAASLPTPTALPTNTPVRVAAALTVEPEELPFALAESSAFPFGDNDYFRVAARVSDEDDNPLGGYYLRVRNETTGQDWLSRQSNGRAWEYSAPSPDFADFREVNVQFDTNGLSTLTDNRYAVWLVDGAGRRVSPIVRFELDDDEFQWLYVVFAPR